MKKPYHFADAAKIEPCNLFGEDVTVLADHRQTGSYEIYLHVGTEGGGPPPHAHPWDEAFYVIGGSVSFDCAGETRTAGPGELVHVAAGTVHSFRYVSPKVHVLGITSRGGAADMFRAVAKEFKEQADLGKIVSVLEKCQVTVVQD